MELIRSENTFEIRVSGRPWAWFNVPRLGDEQPTVTIDDAGGGWQRVRMAWQPGAPVLQDELSVAVHLSFEPDFWWAPHLAPGPEDCIAQHVFRSPALIAAQGADTLVLVPDLDICGQRPGAPWFMDLCAPDKTLWIGMAQTEVVRHVEYRKVGGLVFAPGPVELCFTLSAYVDPDQPRNLWSRVTHFFWERYGQPLFAGGQPHTVPMDRYVDHVYNWAFRSWADAVWQEFELDGQTVGGPAFIVNVTQSPNYPGQARLREFLSIWNQAWFSSLRSASGVVRYARRTGDATLRHKADLTKEFALAAHPCETASFRASIARK